MDEGSLASATKLMYLTDLGDISIIDVAEVLCAIKQHGDELMYLQKPKAEVVKLKVVK